MAVSQGFSPVSSVNDQVGDVYINADELGVAAFVGKTPQTLPLSNAMVTALARRSSQVYTLIELRNQDIVGNQTYFLTEPDRIGFWYYDASDLESQDNIGTVVIGVGGKRYKRVTEGTILSSWFEQSNTGFQNFINASQNKLGIVNKSITLSSTITLRSGTLQQYNGVVVTTTASTGFSATNIELRLDNIIWKAANNSTTTLFNISESRVFFFDVELRNWYNTAINIYSSSLFSQVLRLTGANSDTVNTTSTGKGIVATDLNGSFLNDVYVTGYGNRGIELTEPRSNFFMNVSITDPRGTGSLYITDGTTNSFTNLYTSVRLPELTDSLIFTNTFNCRFINAVINGRLNLTNQLFDVISFESCQFAYLYLGPNDDAFKCTNTTFGGLPCERKDQIILTSVAGQTDYLFPSGVSGKPRYINLNPIIGNPVGRFTVSFFDRDLVLRLDEPIDTNGVTLAFYLEVSI